MITDIRDVIGQNLGDYRITAGAWVATLRSGKIGACPLVYASGTHAHETVITDTRATMGELLKLLDPTYVCVEVVLILMTAAQEGYVLGPVGRSRMPEPLDTPSRMRHIVTIEEVRAQCSVGTDALPWMWKYVPEGSAPTKEFYERLIHDEVTSELQFG